MEKIKIKESISKEELITLCAKHFSGKYEVYSTKLIGADFVVKKSASSGVFLKFSQKDGENTVKFWKNAPSIIYRGLLGIIAFFGGKDVINDVKRFLKTVQK